MKSTILCPRCREPLDYSSGFSECLNKHQFPISNGILNLIPKVDDKSIIEEEQHWNDFAERGLKLNIVPNSFMNKKIYEDYRKVFHNAIASYWPDYASKEICMVDIGCGGGSAIDFLSQIGFGRVNYTGIDVSSKFMLMYDRINTIVPGNWNIQFIRYSANLGLFPENSLDLAFSSAALHHLDVDAVIEWVSKSLKPQGLFILNEPSNKNPFAKIGRKIIRDFHTETEAALSPYDIKDIAHRNNLHLVYEKGLHFISGPLEYLVGILKLPSPVAVFTYFLSKNIDRLVTSPGWSYSFTQIYKKR
jgi:SAM-dependent methyltransferase